MKSAVSPLLEAEAAEARAGAAIAEARAAVKQLQLRDVQELKSLCAPGVAREPVQWAMVNARVPDLGVLLIWSYQYRWADREVDRRPARPVAAVDTHDEAVGRYPLLPTTLMMIQLCKIALHEFCIGKRPANR